MAPPASLVLLGRIQAQMRAVAHRQYESVFVPPFTLFFHATDPLPFFNYAIPDASTAPFGDLAAPLARLRAEFAARRRVSRFEFVEACAPALAAALEAHGFTLENRAQLMVCPRGSERAVPAVARLEIAALDAGSPLGEFASFLDVQRLAFGLPSPEPANPEEARSLRDSLGGGFALAGRLGGRLVATAMIQPGADGLAELVGVATLEECLRPRNLARLSLGGRRARGPRVRSGGILPRRTRALLSGARKLLTVRRGYRPDEPRC